MEEIQKKLQKELDAMKQLQKDYQKTMGIRQQLDAQLSENDIVKEELTRLKSSNTVFKLIGPVLVKQELEEARQTISKRIDYISGELQRQEKLLEEQDKKMNKQREILGNLQTEMQQQQFKSAMKASV